jgi:hypothetical protein
MNLDELGDDAKKQNLLSIMLSMSKVDNVLHDNEMMYIVQLGLSMGMSEESIREIARIPQSDLFVPALESERMTILYYLIFLIKSDGEISEEEKDMFHHFGLKLGFNHLMVANIIRVVQANLGRRLPPNALIEEIRKYLN